MGSTTFSGPVKSLNGFEATSGGMTAGAGTIQNIKTTVDASAGGTATATAICTVPEDSIILDVSAKVTAAFDGDTTTTCEVGVSGNIDKYIDTVELDVTTLNTTVDMYSSTTSDTALPELVAADTDIIATWTNTASASAGEVEVIVTYIELNLSADG